MTARIRRAPACVRAGVLSRAVAVSRASAARPSDREGGSCIHQSAARQPALCRHRSALSTLDSSVAITRTGSPQPNTVAPGHHIRVEQYQDHWIELPSSSRALPDLCRSSLRGLGVLPPHDRMSCAARGIHVALVRDRAVACCVVLAQPLVPFNDNWIGQRNPGRVTFGDLSADFESPAHAGDLRDDTALADPRTGAGHGRRPSLTVVIGLAAGLYPAARAASCHRPKPSRRDRR